MNYDDEMKRIEGYPEPKEIPENFDFAPKAVAKPRRRGNRKVAAAAAAGGSRSGDIKWGILAAVGALVLVGAVYLLSGVRNRPEPTGELTAFVDETVISEGSEDGANGTNAANGAGSTAAQAQDMQLAAIAGEADAVYLFPLDGSGISENAELNALAQEAVLSDADVAVIAYTDETGAADYNQRLSEKRAQAVAQYLEQHGVAHDHIYTQGMGQTHAFATNDLDRRAEVRLL